ncbi:MAG: cellulose biosynthesis cyclic di-GMP-binding regulatory protein BcsB [Anaerolineaceae bacterium]|nr:cellulose biosynthesis cyclic di-GMP-binding regulatory protein BcsB [Anaerolineaceae bacterium]
MPAALPGSYQISLFDLGYTSDHTLEGVNATHTYSFSWPQNWELQSNLKLVIDFSHSPAIDEFSSLTVDWNGTRVGSTLLLPKNADHGKLEIEVEPGLVEEYNNIVLQTYMGIHDEDYCIDLHNPALWLTIHHATSHMDFAYDVIFQDLDLSNFPSPFLDSSALIENNVTFVVPQQPTVGEIEALATVSAVMGNLASWRNMSTTVIADDGNLDISAMMDNAIWIGTASHLPSLTKTQTDFLKNGSLVDRQGKQIPDDAGVLWEQLTPDNASTAMLVVTGQTDEAILKAAHAIADSNTRAMLSGNLGIIHDVPKPEPNGAQFTQELTFEELGYDDRVASGTIEQTLTYVVNTPFAWHQDATIYLDLRFSHSEILDEEQSSLNILLNGIPAATVLLTEDNINSASEQLPLPARLFELGDNTLTIRANLSLLDGYEEESGHCTEREDYSEAWVAVYSHSKFIFPTTPDAYVDPDNNYPPPYSTQLTLAKYPGIFMGAANLSTMAFVVGDSPDLISASTIAAVAARIGRFADGENLWPTVVTASNAKDAEKSTPYQILVGLPTDNKAIADLNDRLPQPFQPGTNEPKAVEGLSRISPAEDAFGFIQAILNEDEYPRLVITGTNQKGLLWAAQALSDPLTSSRLSGDLVILTGEETMTTASIYTPMVGENPNLRPVTETETGSPLTNTPSWVLFVSGVLTIVTVLLVAVLAIYMFAKVRNAKKTNPSNSGGK